MTKTREVSLQTLAVLDQAETNSVPLMGSGQPETVAAAVVFLLRLLTCSSKKLQVSMALDRLDAAGLVHSGQPVTGHESGQTR